MCVRKAFTQRNSQEQQSFAKEKRCENYSGFAPLAGIHEKLCNKSLPYTNTIIILPKQSNNSCTKRPPAQASNPDV